MAILRTLVFILRTVRTTDGCGSKENYGEMWASERLFWQPKCGGRSQDQIGGQEAKEEVGRAVQ